MNCGTYTDEFRLALLALEKHYAVENKHLEDVGASKLVAQHQDVLELGEAVEEALAAGQAGDALATVQRFAALASHNLIEEERDWFPLW